MNYQLLALDLEATLVDDAMSANPRPGLFRFLSFCEDAFPRVALLTTVDEDTAREVLEQLADSRDVPSALVQRMGYIDWEGQFKDLRNVDGIAPDEILFVDDDRGWVHPEQVDQWIGIRPWRGGPDEELTRVQAELARRIGSSRDNGT
ncbi:MAG: NIF family HAD-type phosphatase [Planctomycetota bacterium]